MYIFNVKYPTRLLNFISFSLNLQRSVCGVHSLATAFLHVVYIWPVIFQLKRRSRVNKLVALLAATQPQEPPLKHENMHLLCSLTLLNSFLNSIQNGILFILASNVYTRQLLAWKFNFNIRPLFQLSVQKTLIEMVRIHESSTQTVGNVIAC